jgi:hypothetical protein
MVVLRQERVTTVAESLVQNTGLQIPIEHALYRQEVVAIARKSSSLGQIILRKSSFNWSLLK